MGLSVFEGTPFFGGFKDNHKENRSHLGRTLKTRHCNIGAIYLEQCSLATFSGCVLRPNDCNAQLQSVKASDVRP